jgi:uncharacterized protein
MSIAIYVDADASPVREEAVRVARRYKLRVYLVSNKVMKAPQYRFLKAIVVDEDMDAADDWIVDHVTESDVVVSGDIPLIARCVRKGCRVLDPRGRVFTEESLEEVVSRRDIMTFLRDTGNTDTVSRGPAYTKQDRSRFLQRLDDLIQAIRRGQDKGQSEV